jgi:hypothetical protein
MSHSAEHNRQKEAAREESLRHMKHGSVMENRDGMSHEDHKEEEMKEHGHKVRGAN